MHTLKSPPPPPPPSGLLAAGGKVARASLSVRPSVCLSVCSSRRLRPLLQWRRDKFYPFYMYTNRRRTSLVSTQPPRAHNILMACALCPRLFSAGQPPSGRAHISMLTTTSSRPGPLSAAALHAGACPPVRLRVDTLLAQRSQPVGRPLARSQQAATTARDLLLSPLCEPIANEILSLHGAHQGSLSTFVSRRERASANWRQLRVGTRAPSYNPQRAAGQPDCTPRARADQ